MIFARTKSREIKTIIKSRPTIEGAGVNLKRAFGNDYVPVFDPFLLLDAFHSDNPGDYNRGFPWHPHRGIETITYMLQGDVEHGDSLGNSGVIGPGDVQWMTAGSGIVHQEMPKGDRKNRLWGFQLWANLPASHKMMDPRYREAKSGDILDVLLDNGTTIKVICGEVNGIKGPVQDIVTDPEYLDVTVPPDAEFIHRVKNGHSAFAYVIDGSGYFDESREEYTHNRKGAGYFDMDGGFCIGPEHLVLYDDGGQIKITACGDGVRFLLVSGRPIGEPVAWYGPIVMNTKEELRTAFMEYREGTFIKKGR